MVALRRHGMGSRDRSKRDGLSLVTA